MRFLIVSDHFFQTETVTPPALLHNDPFNHQHQLAPVELATGNTAFRQRKSTPLQSFVIQHEPAVLPVKKLHVRAPTVQENEYVTARGTATETGGHQPAKPIETFTHIAMLAIQIIAVRGTQRKHQPRAINLDNNPK